MIERNTPAASAPQQWSAIFDARRLTEALSATWPPLLFGVRLCSSFDLNGALVNGVYWRILASPKSGAQRSSRIAVSSAASCPPWLSSTDWISER